MKRTLWLLLLLIFTVSCQRSVDIVKTKREIFDTEKAFEKMALEKGIAEAFYFYADANAVILREKDTLIEGKDNIRQYYANKNLKDVTVKWTPDFIEVSGCGTLGYTYGKYVWEKRNEDGKVTETKGIFHTVWKKQKDGTWKYTWD